MAVRAASRSENYGGVYIRRLDTVAIAPVLGKSDQDAAGDDRQPANPFDEEFAKLLFGTAETDDDDGTYAPVPPHIVRS